jgi:hypothetical protein
MTITAAARQRRLSRPLTAPAPPPRADAVAPGTVRVPPKRTDPGFDAPVDMLDQATGGARPLGTPHDDLPAGPVTRNGITVAHGTDPGDFYCEHALWTLMSNAADVGVTVNPKGERQVGFLHIDHDRFCSSPPDAVIDPAVRYEQHRRIIGCALRGYYDGGKAQVLNTEPFKILLTGYGPFMSVTNNPSGGFVAHRDNIDAAMQFAFGGRLHAPLGELVADRVGGSPADTIALKYKVREDNGRYREIVVFAEHLKVADVTLDNGDPGSLVGALKATKPHAALSMGVHGGPGFIVEHHADDGGLRFDNGRPVHDDAQSPRRAFVDNYALGRAIQIGANIGRSPQEMLLAGKA